MTTSPSELPIFDGKDYDDWRKKMRAFLESQDLWHVVVEGYQEAQMQYEDFEEKNASALSFLQEAVADNKIGPKILNSKTAKEAWRILLTESKREVGDSWVIDIQVMMECVDHSHVKAYSISRVPDNLRKVKEEAYSPKVVSIGPFHHGTKSNSELHLMEETKWRYMRALLRRAQTSPERKGELELLDTCSKAILSLDPVVRASYGGDNINLEPKEFARMMIVDGCFFLELLLRLHDFVTKHQPYPVEVEDEALRDLTMLENQIPLIVLKKLHRILSVGGAHLPTFTQLAKTLFGYVSPNSESNSPFMVFHFLHIMYLSSTYNDNTSDTDTTPKEATQELNRCARKLQASGIKIQAGTPVTGNFALNKFVDKFGLDIKFDKYSRTLTIPPLYIKEGAEVKLRNLIAWEQSGIGIGYKFTSYASFFSGLICSFHDIELLRAVGVIKVDDDSNIKDEDLLILFNTIVKGVKKMDSRYSKLCRRVNKKTVVYCLAILNPRVWWHYCRRVLEWLHKQFKIWILDFKKDYMPNPWVFIGVLTATFVVFLTAVQTYYAVFGK